MEVLFYHTETRPLEDVLPELLLRSLSKGWRAIVQIGSDDRLAALDAHLWTFDDASFLPHGSIAEGHAAAQPIWLTTEDDNPNGASIRFFVDGASTDRFADYERIVFIFDDSNPHALETARKAWKAAKSSDCPATYWRQDDAGQWKKRL